MSNDLQTAVISFFCLVVAVILHEISHGVVALWFGDDTAKRAGRLTLNPVSHVDPFGSVILPAMGALAGFPVFGYAKPVPVNPTRMRNPRRDSLIATLAGPVTNLLLMTAAAFAAHAVYDPSTVLPGSTVADLPLLVQVLFTFAWVNLALGVFNFLPIPPLDGSALIERVLPEEWLPQWYRFRPYGFLVLFLLVFSTGLIGRLLNPFYDRLFDFVFR
ncbi:MAG: site-2 protease family protein [Acidimicrobiia bacterium]